MAGKKQPLPSILSASIPAFLRGLCAVRFNLISGLRQHGKSILLWLRAKAKYFRYSVSSSPLRSLEAYGSKVLFYLFFPLHYGFNFAALRSNLRSITKPPAAAMLFPFVLSAPLPNS